MCWVCLRIPIATRTQLVLSMGTSSSARLGRGPCCSDHMSDKASTLILLVVSSICQSMMYGRCLLGFLDQAVSPPIFDYFYFSGVVQWCRRCSLSWRRSYGDQLGGRHDGHPRRGSGAPNAAGAFCHRHLTLSLCCTSRTLVHGPPGWLV